MSCSREIQKLLEQAKRAPESPYRFGYTDALREVLEILEEHEEDE